jgi:hypothetical protein
VSTPPAVGHPRIPFVGAFESTYLPLYDVDVAELTDHVGRWPDDLAAGLCAGVRRFRQPLRWHRIEAEPGCYDWREADAQLGRLHDTGVTAIVDLLHHSSYPRWMDDGFRDERFSPAYLRFAEAFATRYPWISDYTLFNEPLATLFLAGHEALWPPYDSGPDGFVRLATNVLPAVSAAWGCLHELLPDARHVWIDTCEAHGGVPGAPARHAALANDRRFAVLDLSLGHDLDPERPFLRTLVEAGGESLLGIPPLQVDVLGLDYYPHSEWWYDERWGSSPSPHPQGFAAVAQQYASRYSLPMLLAETNVRGQPSDRASWLRYMLEQYQLAREHGVPLEGFCWFPFVDSCDWDSLLARPGRRPDPVGVTSLGPGSARVRTCFTQAWEAASRGEPAERLPAYRFQPPCDEQLAGYVSQLDHWPWQEPPADDSPPAVHVPADRRTTMPTSPPRPTPDLVVLSHLRWDWVWQRPQHLVSRFAARRAGRGARTWFVEEPVFGPVDEPQLVTAETESGVTRIWCVVPERYDTGRHPGFDAPGAEEYGDLLAEHLREAGVLAPEVLLYTPMALDLAEALSPVHLLYDVMDDLAAFRGASQGLVLRHRRALTEAALVFAGGRSLHRSVSQHRSTGTLLVPSGVETAHFARSLALRRSHSRPVAGYVGVIDERVDLKLLAELAGELPGWTIRVVGPVAKVDPDDLPHASTIEYPGMAAYADLPKVMAGFDVALMPFALNEATRSISPTKTLEYLAAGLPVVSTRVPDVVADHADAVTLADDAGGFAWACRRALREPAENRVARARRIARGHEWDVVAQRMLDAVDGLAAPVTRKALEYATEAGA